MVAETRLVGQPAIMRLVVDVRREIVACVAVTWMAGCGFDGVGPGAASTAGSGTNMDDSSSGGPNDGANHDAEVGGETGSVGQTGAGESGSGSDGSVTSGSSHGDEDIDGGATMTGASTTGVDDGGSTGMSDTLVAMTTTSGSAGTTGDASTAGESGESGGESGGMGGCFPASAFVEKLLVADATVTPPMQTDTSFSQGEYAFSEISKMGTVEFTFELECPGSFVIWAVVWDAQPGAHGSDPDSFAVRHDGGLEAAWAYGCQTELLRDDEYWSWQQVRKRDVISGCVGVSSTYTMALDAGVHTISFRNLEGEEDGDHAGIARILVTNDIFYVPDLMSD